MMEGEARAPKVTHLSWGRLEVEGVDVPFKDAKLFPGVARSWDWNETGTSHDPGIQPADVEELLERGATAVVLSRGFNGRLGVTRDALRMLEDRRVPTHVRQTGAAIELYNELIESESVGALIHSTC
jgi:hypothetical protein